MPVLVADNRHRADTNKVMRQLHKSNGILLVADLRTSHALSWLDGLVEMGVEVIAISSRPLGRVRLEETPDYLLERIVSQTTSPWNTARSLVAPSDVEARGRGRYSVPSLPKRPGNSGTGRLEARVEILNARFLAREIRRVTERFKPRLIHALRIPFEGVGALLAKPQARMAISIWGQDLVSQAKNNQDLGRMTRLVLQRADGLHADTERDLLLAREWGLRGGMPALLAPVNMGLDLSMFSGQGLDRRQVRQEFGLPHNGPVVLNPRRPVDAKVAETFVEAMSNAIRRIPNISVLWLAAEGYGAIHSALERHRILDHVRLLPAIAHERMPRALVASDVVVSVSKTDGAPVSILEAMASGTPVVAGDVNGPSEILRDGQGGVLVAPDSSNDIADAVCAILLSDGLCDDLATRGRTVARRYSRLHFGPLVKKFYDDVGAR